jgi:hypothetical protein
VQAALRAFAGRPEEAVAIQLFQLYDRITSQIREVSQAELVRAHALAREQGARGLTSFLALQLGSRALSAWQLPDAGRWAEVALQSYTELSVKDAVYERRLNRSAAFLYVVALESGDKAFQAQVLREHRDKIEAYSAHREQTSGRSTREVTRRSS